MKMQHFGLPGMWPPRKRSDKKGEETSVIKWVCRGWATLEISPSPVLQSNQEAEIALDALFNAEQNALYY